MKVALTGATGFIGSHVLSELEAHGHEVTALVRDEEHSAGEIAAEFTVSWPAVSQHLRVLKEAGLVTERREGTRRLYRARPEGLDDVRAFLDEFWDNKLERLKREVERG